MDKFVYLFPEGNASMRTLLGGKGANLAEMTGLGLPVPPGFTITTQACNRYYDNDCTVEDAVIEQAMHALAKLEQQTGKLFGDPKNPLLVSVRSGAAVSMPGMMDTILNLGLNDETCKGLGEATDNERFAKDSYRRFIQMFSNVVMELDMAQFEACLENKKQKAKAKVDSDLSAEALSELIEEYKRIYLAQNGEPFPQNPRMQLTAAIEAVFRSWNNPRANIYRKLNDIPSSLGTAVTVQSMVFGNMGDDCGTGVAFTRSPSTGENKLFGEFLMNAQGEDVVAGIRTPKHISELKEDMPEAYAALCEIADTLEGHFHDVQDIEFTIEHSKIYMLQTRNAKRTAEAALKIAVDMAAEGIVSREEALLLIDAKQLNAVLHPTFDKSALGRANHIAIGLPASPGAACGRVYFNAEDAESAAATGKDVILVRTETSPEDIQGMYSARGILTARGGMTSHAAVVARGMGRCCIAGCNEIFIDEQEKTFKTAENRIFHEGDYISLDGGTGYVYGEEIPTVPAAITGNFDTVMQWADEFKRLGVAHQCGIRQRTPLRQENSGAEGIGLCRTEHMFFETERIASVRRMIVSDNKLQRQAALEELLPMQKTDFKGLYRAMGSRPVTIRLLDPPLHEFLPREQDEIAELAKTMGISYEKLSDKVESLKEVNPMLGHRGCRLAITWPGIARMQVTAIIEAAIEITQEEGFAITPRDHGAAGGGYQGALFP